MLRGHDVCVSVSFIADHACVHRNNDHGKYIWSCFVEPRCTGCGRLEVDNRFNLWVYPESHVYTIVYYYTCVYKGFDLHEECK